MTWYRLAELESQRKVDSIAVAYSRILQWDEQACLEKSYNWMIKVREGRPSLACREDDERFCLCGRVDRQGTTTWRFLSSTSNINFFHASVSPPGFSVEHVTYPSSWTGGRGWKWMGRRRSWRQEPSVCRPRKDCDKDYLISWSDSLRQDSVPRLGNNQSREDGCSWQGQWRERWKNWHLQKSSCVRNHINTCRYYVRSCTVEANLQIRFCWESF